MGRSGFWILSQTEHARHARDTGGSTATWQDHVRFPNSLMKETQKRKKKKEEEATNNEELLLLAIVLLHFSKGTMIVL